MLYSRPTHSSSPTFRTERPVHQLALQTHCHHAHLPAAILPAAAHRSGHNPAYTDTSVLLSTKRGPELASFARIDSRSFVYRPVSSPCKTGTWSRPASTCRNQQHGCCDKTYLALARQNSAWLHCPSMGYLWSSCSRNCSPSNHTRGSRNERSTKHCATCRKSARNCLLLGFKHATRHSPVFAER